MPVLLREVIQGSKPGDTFIRLAVHNQPPALPQRRTGTQPKPSATTESGSQRPRSRRKADAGRDN